MTCKAWRPLAGLFAAAFIAAPAWAQTPAELGWCTGDANATPALQIKDCTAVIQGGKATPLNLVIALTIRGRAYDLVGDQARALEDLNRAIELNATNAGAFMLRGAVHGKRRTYDSAIADYTEAVRLDPKLASALSDRGLAYAGKGEFGRAIADYTEAIRIDPKLAVAFNNRGVARTRSPTSPRRSGSIRTTSAPITAAATSAPRPAPTPTPSPITARRSSWRRAIRPPGSAVAGPAPSPARCRRRSPTATS